MFAQWPIPSASTKWYLTIFLALQSLLFLLYRQLSAATPFLVAFATWMPLFAHLGLLQQRHVLLCQKTSASTLHNNKSVPASTGRLTFFVGEERLEVLSGLDPAWSFYAVFVSQERQFKPQILRIYFHLPINWASESFMHFRNIGVVFFRR